MSPYNKDIKHLILKFSQNSLNSNVPAVLELPFSFHFNRASRRNLFFLFLA